jgi:hypothetical protein
VLSAFTVHWIDGTNFCYFQRMEVGKNSSSINYVNDVRIIFTQKNNWVWVARGTCRTVWLNSKWFRRCRRRTDLGSFLTPMELRGLTRRRPNFKNDIQLHRSWYHLKTYPNGRSWWQILIPNGYSRENYNLSCSVSQDGECYDKKSPQFS